MKAGDKVTYARRPSAGPQVKIWTVVSVDEGRGTCVLQHGYQRERNVPVKNLRPYQAAR